MVGTTFDSATTSLAQLCITDAENELRKRLSKRYDFSIAPFLLYSTVPPMVITLAETLAVGYMYENMSRGGKEANARADRYIKRAMENITDLLEGSAQLVTSAGVLVDEISGDWRTLSSTDNYSPTFNEDDPDSWAVSSNKLDDISSEREE